MKMTEYNVKQKDTMDVHNPQNKNSKSKEKKIEK